MKIAVICGGRSSERDVSLSTGAKVAAELRNAGHRVVYADACEGVELDCTPEEAFDKMLPIPQYRVGETAPDVAKYFERPEGFFGKNVLELCKAADIVFNALHGDEGENGKLQATFDLLNIRYTGTGSQGCLLGMNKSLSKMIFHSHDIPTPEEAILHGESVEESLRKCAWIGYPCVVKPASLGSSVGVSIAHDEKEFRAALQENRENYEKRREAELSAQKDRFAAERLELVRQMESAQRDAEEREAKLRKDNEETVRRLKEEKESALKRQAEALKKQAEEEKERALREKKDELELMKKGGEETPSVRKDREKPSAEKKREKMKPESKSAKKEGKAEEKKPAASAEK